MNSQEDQNSARFIQLEITVNNITSLAQCKIQG